MFIKPSKILTEITCFFPECNSLYIFKFVVKQPISKVWPKVKLGHTSPTEKQTVYNEKVEPFQGSSVISQVELLLFLEEILAY